MRLQSSFPACFSFTKQAEGGLSLNPDDPGNYYDGELIGSNYGVTPKTLASWLKPQVVTSEMMANLDPATVQAIFKAMFWKATDCNALPAGVDLMVMDFAYNGGVGPSGRILQRCVGAKEDGDIGDDTLLAVKKVQTNRLYDFVDADAVQILQAALGLRADGVIGPITQKALATRTHGTTLMLIAALATQQAAHYRLLPKFKINGAGWLARTTRRQAAALLLALADAETLNA